MKVSFCITCKNRFHQISKTLPENLADNRGNQAHVEFVLVDFSSETPLRDWVVANFREDLDSEFLKFYTTDEMPYWDCAKAKNTAHFFGTGDILVNLDCDNYTGKDGGAFVINQFILHGEKLLLHQSSPNPMDGNFGRISMLRKFFFTIGGYDESFSPMGYQDTDLIHRLEKFGLKYVCNTNPSFNRAIANTKEESIKYANSNKSYREMAIENGEISKFNLKRDKLVANNGHFGIRSKIWRYESNPFKEIPKSTSV